MLFGQWATNKLRPGGWRSRGSSVGDLRNKEGLTTQQLKDLGLKRSRESLRDHSGTDTDGETGEGRKKAKAGLRKAKATDCEEEAVLSTERKGTDEDNGFNRFNSTLQTVKDSLELIAVAAAGEQINMDFRKATNSDKVVVTQSIQERIESLMKENANLRKANENLMQQVQSLRGEVRAFSKELSTKGRPPKAADPITGPIRVDESEDKVLKEFAENLMLETTRMVSTRVNSLLKYLVRSEGLRPQLNSGKRRVAAQSEKATSGRTTPVQERERPEEWKIVTTAKKRKKKKAARKSNDGTDEVIEAGQVLPHNYAAVAAKGGGKVKERKCNWKCPECSCKQPKTGNLNTPIHQATRSEPTAADNIVTEVPSSQTAVGEKCVASPPESYNLTSPLQADNVTIRARREQKDFPRHNDFLTEERLRVILSDTLHASIRDLVSVQLKVLNDQVNELKDSMTFYNQKYEEMKTSLEEKIHVIDELQGDNWKLKSTLADVSNRLNMLEQNTRECNIEVNGIPEHKTENLVQTIEQLAKVIAPLLKKIYSM
ncbi:unnamed protein product [Chilo suppressalis]|uniref:Uncharacterized protein n=1 Tax=Chilo suppressalis TaxID=168631 RepID=A0ABN8AW90_CHISP|nr:unnamed protein product [Chilo suppressalis]